MQSAALRQVPAVCLLQLLRPAAAGCPRLATASLLAARCPAGCQLLFPPPAYRCLKLQTSRNVQKQAWTQKFRHNVNK